MSKILVAGIDTDIGKTYVTGILAKYLLLNKKKVTTMKLAQTGCVGLAEDITTHRKIMQAELNKYDANGTSCPYVFRFPASPHLAAELEGKEIDVSVISHSVELLSAKFEYLIIEGVGGLMVPLNNDYTSLDFIKEEALDVILVSSPKLGSINHTLLSIEALSAKAINLLGIVYNKFGDFDKKIAEDTIKILKKHMISKAYQSIVIEIDDVSSYSDADIKNLFNKLKI